MPMTLTVRQSFISGSATEATTKVKRIWICRILWRKTRAEKPLINGLFNEQTRDDKGDSKGFATLSQSLRKYAKVTCNYLVKLHGVEQLYFSKKPVRVSLFE